ncbi:DUF389 domain-containing protein [Synechococcus sp. LA31]|jgi:uncharacterized hydrophobic protein (TIGR00271 family)|uniref:DUF389 domain-containing protein n=2 Tax=Synechococcaceae TaxID=1890426 RepID=UPI001BDC544B|nr:DUF389 domain-containing protein [Synechococcus sp. LA31]QVV68052.1 DUF389 domain-containing protein [Synechococcus sp. LA31]
MAQPTSLASLEAGFEQEARLDEPFVVLTVAASLIATLGLLADSAAVVIGAMLIAPWILPLRSASFAIIDGRLNLAGKALLTLAVGVTITIALSASLGWLARLPVLGDEVLRRTTPNLLDLGIALVAGSIATYGRLRQEAVSSIAGTAIAVALVPPVCVLGLLLSIQQWEPARGAALLFAANLLGILSGGLLTLVVSQASLRQKLWRSRVGLVSLLLTGLLLIPLTGSFLTLVAQAQRRVALQEVERAITESLRQRTLTLGKDSELTGVTIDWNQNPPLIKAAVSVIKPNLPTPKQVAAVQDFINKQMKFNYRLVVKRVSIDVIGPEAAPNLEPATADEEGPPKPLTPPLPPPPPPVPATEESPAADSKPLLNEN